MANDLVKRLRHCSENCGDEYLRELTGRAAARIEQLEAALQEAATSLDQAANELCDCRKAGTKRVCRGAYFEQSAKEARAALEGK